MVALQKQIYVLEERVILKEQMIENLKKELELVLKGYS